VDVGEQLVPADGVYGGWAVVEPGNGSAGARHRAAISIGTAPTFEGARRQVEAFLLDFSGDLYGRRMSLEVTEWVRDQMRFPSTERLIERMHADVALLAG
jgi:riboflavin kinase/FMN adenylyltransferase